MELKTFVNKESLPASPHGYVSDKRHRTSSNSLEPMLPVLFVAFQTGKQANGGISSLDHIIRRLKTVRPLIVTQLETPVTARWRQLGYEVEVWSLPPLPRHPAAWSGLVSRAQRIGPLLATNLRIYRLLRERGIRVVHCNDVSALWHTALGAKTAGARIVFNIRGTTNVAGFKWRASRLLSDRVVALSNEMRTVLTQRLPPFAGLPARWMAEIDVIYSVVDFERFHPVAPAERDGLRSNLGIAPGEFAVGIVAAFGKRKQQLELLWALAANRWRLLPATRLYFVGDFDPTADEYARRCLQIVQSSGLSDTARFVGYTPDVHHWYQALDVTLLVSRDEGLARSMIESLACGTPVVSFDVCSAREILEGHRCGVVVPQGDFIGALQALHRLGCNPELRASLGSAGALLARRLLTPDAVVRAYERLYAELHSTGVATGATGTG